MTPALVLLTLTFCLHTPQPGDAWCDDMEIRAASCAQALDWAHGWMPPGARIISADCRDERHASR